MKFIRCEQCKKEVPMHGLGVEGTWEVRQGNQQARHWESSRDVRDFCSLKCLAEWASTYKDEDLT